MLPQATEGVGMNQKHINELIEAALAIEAEDAKRAGTLGFVARVLAQTTLPHKAQPGNQFTRRNGAFELSITALSPVGLPYGSIPRLLLSWMTTEAVRTRSPVLELGPTLSAFMAELGLARRGGERGDITRLRNQAERLFSSAISCRYKDEGTTQGGSFNITKDYKLWWNPKTPNQLPLWKSTVTLGTDFFKEIIDRPIPVDMRALQALKRSPLELDIYCWLTHRMSYLRKDTVIPWPLLQLQFGADYADDAQGLRDFKKKFLKRLLKVRTIYPKAKVAEAEQGLLLKPSPPHVVRLPEPLAAWERQRHAAAVVQADEASAALAGLLETPAIRLQTATYEKAKRAAPGFDVYALEQEWRNWIAKKGKQPKNPDIAFVGFCRRKAQPKR
jgi:hypothetical protein